MIRTKLAIAATEGAEPIATGEVVGGSTLRGAPFCVGGTIRDSHAEKNSDVEPTGHQIARKITCPDGDVIMGFTPQTGSWTIVGGTGAFEELRGQGEMSIKYDPNDEALGLETLTGTVTG